MAHEVETMAYNAIEKPWHGLGNPVSGNQSVDDMLIAAGLPWNVESKKLYTTRFIETGGTTEMEYVALDELNTENIKYRAIMRESDGYVFNILTDAYSIVQNREVMEFFREYVEAANMSLETAGALKHGALIWVLAKVEAKFTLPGGDVNETYLLLSNSHDGSQEFNGQFTSIRVVCANTLRMAVAAKRGKTFSLKHNTKMTAEILEDAKKQLGLAVETTARFEEIASKLAEYKVDTQQTLRYVAELMQPKLLSEPSTALVPMSTLVANQPATIPILEAKQFNRAGREVLTAISFGAGSQLESAKDTAWGLLNGVTNYIDHSYGRTRDAGLTSAWFGANAELKQRAMVAAKSLAGIK